MALESDSPGIAAGSGLDLADLLRDEGQVQEAIDVYRRVAALNHPVRSPHASLRLGNIYRDQGDLDHAREAYSRAVESEEPVTAAQARKHLRTLK